MSTHSTLSPSSRHRWSRCAASVRVEAPYPDTSGPAAIDGTHTHSLVETCIKANLADPMEYVGKTLTDHEGSFTVDAARAKRAKMCIDYVQSLVGGETTIRAECRVDPFYLVGRLDMAGTVDVQIYRTDVWHLIDVKDGGGLVEVIENPQLLQYGVALVAEALAAQKKLPDRVVLTIVQPKLADRGLPPIQSWTVTTQRLIEEAETLKRQGAATDDPNAPFTPGEVQCRYCKHNRNCQAKAEKVMSEFKLENLFPIQDEKGWHSAPLSPAPVLDIANQAANKNPTEMPDEQLRQILDAAPLMRQLLESVEEEALSRLKSGKTIPGLKLVNGRGSRNWAESEEAMLPKLTRMGIPKASCYVTKFISPAQAEKITWTKRDGTAVQLSPRQLERMEKEFVVKMAGKLTVAPESDSRAAVTMDASPLFGAVESQPCKTCQGLGRTGVWLDEAKTRYQDNPCPECSPVSASPIAATPETPALPDWLSS